MSALRLAAASLALVAFSDVRSQALVPPPMVPSREVDLTAPIDPFPPALAWQRAFGNANGGCVLGIGGERLVAIPVAIDGTPGAQVVAPLPPGSTRAHGFAAVLAGTGRLHVALGVDDPAGGRRLAALHSDDCGGTWSPAVTLNASDTPGGSSFQSSFRLVAIDADGQGRAAIAWLPYTSPRVVVSTSADGGATWTAPVESIDDVPGDTSFANLGLDVAIDPASGAVVVASADLAPGYPLGAVVRTSRSTDGGRTFSDPALVPGTPTPSAEPDAAFPDLAVLPDGSIALVFSESDGSVAGTGIAQLRTTDGGAGWTRGPRLPFGASGDANYWQIDPAVVREGDQALVYWPGSSGLAVARWDGAASAFVGAQTLTPFVFRPAWIQGFASLARAANGTWALAYLASGQPQETR
ncbi:MAG TPA: sialidase family protein, partial [Candidatus Polarisedimenticolaceae bacterium]